MTPLIIILTKVRLNDDDGTPHALFVCVQNKEEFLGKPQGLGQAGVPEAALSEEDCHI